MRACQRLRQPRWPNLQAMPDLVRREAKKFQRQDLLQAKKVRLRVDSVTGFCVARRREQPHLIIEAQGAHRDGSLLRELARSVEMFLCVQVLPPF